jgi:predicted transglutaminase-like cysteine proteinase
MKRTIPVALLLTMLIGGSILPAGCHQGFSHQPSTINQMKLLVTPQDPTVTQALQEALATPDTSVSDAPSTIVSNINKMRLWVFSNIKQASDDALHGVNDYWQTPTETLSLKAGDCEDFAILMVSIMRAYGAPQDQVYVAIGTDANKSWHAVVLERYSYGAWVEFDPENLDDPVLLTDFLTQYFDISYCFNDQGGFNGTPVYPASYVTPTSIIIPVLPNFEPIFISDISSHNKSLDDVKQRLGELWLPRDIPQGYYFAHGAASHYDGGPLNSGWGLVFTYLSEPNNQLMVLETELQSGFFQPSGDEQIIINNQPAYLSLVPYDTSTSNSSMLRLDFVQGGLHISLGGIPGSSFTAEELIKIAESFIAYYRNTGLQIWAQT